VTGAEDVLRAGLEDAVSHFGLLEATLRAGKMEPTAEIVRQLKNKASAALDRAALMRTSSDPNEETRCAG
jgi:hypothetical protein